jgi:pSer/pThr/pTyr-binding forkhead associated (FHA) protein
MHAELLVTKGGEEVGRMVIRPGQVFLVGRGRDVTLRLSDPKVSRRHCSVELKAEGLFVTDLSSNGTYVTGGSRLKAKIPMPIAEGAELVLGSHRLRHTLFGFGDRDVESTRRFRFQDSELIPETEFQLLEQLGCGANGRAPRTRTRPAASASCARGSSPCRSRAPTWSRSTTCASSRARR